MTEKDIACICKAMADEKRLRIIRMLNGGEKYGNTILEELNITQPTLSHHMKILCDCGLVRARKNGNRTYYFLCCKIMHDFNEYISSLECRNFGDCDCHCAKST